MLPFFRFYMGVDPIFDFPSSFGDAGFVIFIKPEELHPFISQKML